MLIKRLIVFCLTTFLSCLVSSQTVFQWARQIGGSETDNAVCIKTDGLGNAITVGTFSNIADLDPGPSVLNFNSSGNLDVFISKLDPNGNFIWAKQIGGPGIDIPTSVVLDKFGNVYTLGLFSDTVDFDPGIGTFTFANT